MKSCNRAQHRELLSEQTAELDQKLPHFLKHRETNLLL